MGRAKQEWMDDQERGWTAPDTFVCDECIEDEFLKDVVRKNAVEVECSYCQRVNDVAIAAPAEAVIEAVDAAIRLFYASPDHAGVPWDGGYIVDSIGTNEVLDSLPLGCSDAFLQDVVDAYHDDAWVSAADGHWLSDRESTVLDYAWQGFVRSVKHITRFHFAQAAPDPSSGPRDLTTAELLPSLGRIVSELGLVRTIEAGLKVYRTRLLPAEPGWEPNAGTMGAPPADSARAGRMNPAGISYFYCAFKRSTAIAEILPTPPLRLVAAEFEVVRPVRVLNFCDMPPPPSVFDVDKHDRFEWLRFLRGFVREISEPVRKDGGEHIDYVPSQVVCEWFAQAFKDGISGAGIDGLIYPSAIAKGGKNLVLFPTGHDYRNRFDMLEFVSAEYLSLANWDSVIAVLR